MLLGKKIIAIIPARSKSSGLINKNIKKINSIPLLGYTGLFLNNLNYIDECIISTDSIYYQKIAKKFNINSFFLRPNKLSGPSISDTQVIDHAINYIENFKKEKFDIILYLQPTSPNRAKADMTKAIKYLIKNKLDSVWSVTKIDKKFHPLKVLKRKKNNSFDFYLKNGKNIIARQQLDDVYIRNGVFYILNTQSFKKNKSLIGKKNSLFEIKNKSFNIDNLNDFNKFKDFMNEYN